MDATRGAWRALPRSVRLRLRSVPHSIVVALIAVVVVAGCGHNAAPQPSIPAAIRALPADSVAVAPEALSNVEQRIAGVPDAQQRVDYSWMLANKEGDYVFGHITEAETRTQFAADAAQHEQLDVGSARHAHLCYGQKNEYVSKGYALQFGYGNGQSHTSS